MWGCVRGARCGLIGFIVLLTAGCGYKYKGQESDFSSVYEHGDFIAASKAATEARANAEKNEQRNLLIWLLEEGSSCRAANRFDESSAALERAEKIFDECDQKAKVRISREIYAAFTNPMALDYEGCGYERIMLNVYDALNYLDLGKKDDIRVAIKRIADAQDKCEQRYADQIAAAKGAQEPDDDAVVARVKSDKSFQSGQSQFLADFPDVQSETAPDRLTHKRLYVNAFAEYLQGLYYLNSGEPGERELGRVAIRNAAGMVPENRYLADDVRYADAAAAGAAPVAPRVYVLFETGIAPYRKEIRIDIPLFILNLAYKDTKVDYIGVAFPVLKRHDNAVPYLEASADGRSYQTATLADLDKIVAREFKDELPQIITRTVISAVAKAAVQYGVAKSVEKQSPLVQIFTRAAVAVVQAAFNETEVRCWHTLPKQVQLASFPVPASGTVTLSLPGGQPAGTVQLPPGKSSIIWVKTIGPQSPPQVHSIVMN